MKKKSENALKNREDERERKMQKGKRQQKKSEK